jgi:hypothetical protein
MIRRSIMAPTNNGIDDSYEVKKITPMQSADGSKSNWVTVHYGKKNPPLTTKGCISASGK